MNKPREKGYKWIDPYGSFCIQSPESSSYLYFPLAGCSGLKSSVTPLLGGDCMIDQNSFVLQPCSVEDLHSSKSSRNFWLVFEPGKAWSACGMSAETETLKGSAEEEQVSISAGLMWHRVSRYSPKYALAAEITSFIPLGNVCTEIMQVRITNQSSAPVRFIPVSAIPLYGRSADSLRDHRHVTSLLHKAVISDYGIELAPSMSFDERGHRTNRRTYYVFGVDGEFRKPEGCCPSAANFVGEGGSYTRPEQIYSLRESADCWMTVGGQSAGEEVVGALRFAECRLEPGESSLWTLCIGTAEKDCLASDKETILRDFFSDHGLSALKTVEQTWRSRNNIYFHTDDEDFNRFMYWVEFQPTLRRMFGCSFLPYHDYGKGGRGWRDLWQDCLALLLMDPRHVRGMLVNGYGGVRFDGTNATIIGSKDGEFLADRNTIPRVWMDHGFWPFLTTELYIQQTGDMSVLWEQREYFKDSQIFRSEERDMLWTAEQGTQQRDNRGRVVTGSVLEHILIQNISAFYDVGEHNHIRLRDGDWNDGLDMARERGESVTFTSAYAGNYRKIASLLRRAEKEGAAELELNAACMLLFSLDKKFYGDIQQKRAVQMRFHESCAHVLSGDKVKIATAKVYTMLEDMAAWIENHIRETEWTQTASGAFFNGYYDNCGMALEGERDGALCMTLTGQVFPIMFGTADEAQVKSIIASADALLYRADQGGYRLNTDYTRIGTNMGRAFSFAYGHKENGAVFSHMVALFASALYRRGFVQAGFKAINKLFEQAMNFSVSRSYPGLPEYFDNKGRGRYPYLTGSASWFMLTVITEMFGIRGEFGDLVLSPKLLDCQLDTEGRISVDMVFAEIPVHVEYTAAVRKEKYTEAYDLTLDGKPIAGNKIEKSLLVDLSGERRMICAKLR